MLYNGVYNRLENSSEQFIWETMSITTAQIRGARGILNWSQSELAERTGISATSIGSIENGISSARANTLITIRKAFEDAGIEFIGLDGVRIRNGDIRIFQGKESFMEFFDHVYETVKNKSGEIFVSNVSERKFIKLAGERADEHMQRMAQLKGLSFKVLLKEGDQDFAASQYVEYKWMKKEFFASVPFYVFDKQLAIILLEDEPRILLLQYPAIADAFRLQFLAMWHTAMVPMREAS